VVQVLAPSGIIEADGLDMTAVVRADPHIAPRRRNGETTHTREHIGVMDRTTMVEVREPAPLSSSGDAGRRRIDAVQSRHDDDTFALRRAS
jgi:hypothetical protein